MSDSTDFQQGSNLLVFQGWRRPQQSRAKHPGREVMMWTVKVGIMSIGRFVVYSPSFELVSVVLLLLWLYQEQRMSIS